MRRTRRYIRQLREGQRGATAAVRLRGRPPAAAAGLQGHPTTAAVARSVLLRAAQILAAVLGQLGYRLVPWLALPVPGSMMAVGMLLSLASSRFVPARAYEKVVALATRGCRHG
jgi:hypothetical protein